MLNDPTTTPRSRWANKARSRGAIGALREVLFAVVRWSGIAAAVHAAVSRRVSVLVYHDPPPSLLERHLEYLSKHYRFLALGDLVDALHARDWRRIPPKSVVLTFDDGHRGNADLLPLFRRYGVRPTIFICSQLVGTNRHFWFSGASDPEALKRLPNDERLVRLERETGFSPTREYPTNERQTLSRAEIEQMKEHVDFASHTRFHPLLPSCTDEECEVEIRESKAEVERLTGEPCRHFSHS